MTERRDDAEERKGPVIRDKRRIDPETGEVREPADTSAPESPTAKAPSGADAEKAAKLEKELAERTADLQRLQAEYSNYRKRVDRDRTAVREQALAYVLGELLPVLDDIGRAREHDELTGGFKHVAEALEGIVGKLGLESFGTAGEPFDPNVHEALMHSYSDEVAEPTAVQILQAGYRIGERTLRPARVAVAEPTADLGSAEEAASEPEPASAADGGKAEAEPDGAGED
ncbi:nucleotide exchange factor GrpE [Actinoallomurus rhizosphaericola]|uniref:nucleotide exchange factor GrpE n=1 Tax=Actinoallomurus rhizosphaericola TaxID=2952536 RepID=UPI002091ED91|nr:nucleotide exchange factor GrpE [Actinoallomurus rhizosphaericola]MCO5997463.1 nucleotide exchange factor GrpE [Actinoallomurus rhizosphaericola]